MNNIAFGSTYRVYFVKDNEARKNSMKYSAKTTKGQKNGLKALAQKYNHAPIPKGGNSNENVKFSARKKFDKQIEATLKALGIANYEKVEIHNVPSDQINDVFEKTGRFAFLREDYKKEEIEL